MATLLLAAAGSALGGAVGGSFAGIGAMALGKAAGAIVGQALDQRLLGAGAAPVETGRVERFRVMGSSEGAALARVFGRYRIAGQMIWSSRFLESVHTENVGGKGGGASVREYSYTVSFAIALCEGELSRIGRIWADGQPIEQKGLNFRLHRGSADQLPDPLIEAIEGEAPAYRGVAYVVFENLDLTPFGNRIPQFNFEVFRRPSDGLPDGVRSPALDVRGVALVPGCGEYALATEEIHFKHGKGDNRVLNVHNDQGVPDLVASLDQLTSELPNAKSVSLVVSWFGDDLRCGRCSLRPAVEQADQDAKQMPWVVSGQPRAQAHVVSKTPDNRPIFGGTPADASVVQAIRRIKGSGLSVMFYPFILMDIQGGNGLSDPWTGATDQPPVPWRGRITLDRAPGRAGSVDKSAAARNEVARFFGVAAPDQFSRDGETVAYTGPQEWSYRRFVLHYAHLCALAGGVDAFCIGSEMRGLTQIRDSAAGYPAVRELCTLAADVRSILGDKVKVGYAADWSEYFGHQPDDGSGDVLYHLDPLWASPDVDFIGIDNYMPLSDWRDGRSHADAAAGSIYNLDYLKSNVAGGEGYDWYYTSDAARDAQDRTPIADGAYGEHWVFRYKDLVNWWSRAHVNRLGGLKMSAPTIWKPKSKPIWFTELGCPAVNKGTNQPNVFYDPKSSESFFPYHSNGSRDDFMQVRYLQAMFAHWNDLGNNPYSPDYNGRMVDMRCAHVWAWDARPWPDFPSRRETWVDGGNYETGHWLNGRASLASLAEVVAEVCDRSDLGRVDVSRLYGAVKGYAVESLETGRQSIQPLMLAYAFDGFSIGEAFAFVSRAGASALEVASEALVVADAATLSCTRTPSAEAAERVTVGYIRAEQDYQPGAVDSLVPDAAEPRNEETSVPVVMTEAEAKAIADRALSEGWIARDTASFALPPSKLGLTPGDLLSFAGDASKTLYRVDRIDEGGHRSIAAVRIEASVYEAPVPVTRNTRRVAIPAQVPADVTFLDIPLLTGDEDPVAPHIAVARSPWAGAVAVYSASDDYGYGLDRLVNRAAVMGVLLDPLAAGSPGLWMRASARVRLSAGALQSRSEADVLNGANVAAVRREGARDWEILQFLKAELVGTRVYRVSGFLRGQAGTDAFIPSAWPSGSDFVLLDSGTPQINLPSAARGRERHFRVGPAIRSYEDASYVHSVEVFSGVGLRPYRPGHLRVVSRSDGGVLLSWIRRTRIDGDSWDGMEVPVGEEREQYIVRVSRGGATIRETSVDKPEFAYTHLDRTEDRKVGSGPTTLSVAQVSLRFGPGPFEGIELDD